MTREEAIAKVTAVEKNRSIAQFYVDAQVALGLLKLDEPKSADQKFIEAIEKHGFYKSVGEQVLGAINAAGLKIVEK